MASEVNFDLNGNPLSYDTFSDKLLDRALGTVEYGLNGQAHEIQIFFTNGDIIYPVAPTAIVDLSIENTIADWFTQGTLTLYNSNELIEYLSKYTFRSDGEDILRIRIIPRDLNIQGLPSLDIEKNRHLWEMNELFSIYDIEDVTPQSGGGTPAKALKKFKKLKFWDLRYQIMLTKNIEYSTALSPNAPIGINSSLPLLDENRSIPTGIAIDEIIKKSLNYSFLARTGLNIDADKYWDEGGRTIFYTSGADTTCVEDLDYVKSRHISSIQFDTSAPDLCLFSIERSNDGLGFFSLKPFSKIFKNAGTNQPGPDQIEHFYLYADAKEESQGIPSFRSPVAPSTTRDITLRDYSYITSYELTDISPLVNAGDFASYSVHSFDFLKRQFNIEFKAHNNKNAQKIFQEKYVSQLYKNNKSGNSNFLLGLNNKAKLTNQSTVPIFNTEGDADKPEIRAISGLYRLLYTGLFQNTCINFTVPGLTLRQAGKFIAIDRPTGSIENTFDDKICGQWFVINVIHTISNGAYYNNITAVKIHRYKSTTSEQRATEKFVDRLAGPGQSLQKLLFSGSRFIAQ